MATRFMHFQFQLTQTDNRLPTSVPFLMTKILATVKIKLDKLQRIK